MTPMELFISEQTVEVYRKTKSAVSGSDQKGNRFGRKAKEHRTLCKKQNRADRAHHISDDYHGRIFSRNKKEHLWQRKK